MPTLKNRHYEIFAAAVAAGKTNSEAYAAAGFTANHKNARRKASLLGKRPEVAERIEELKKFATERVLGMVTMDKAWILQQAQDALLAAKADRSWSAVARLLELIGREFKVFVETKNLTVRRFADMTEEELRGLLDEYEAGNDNLDDDSEAVDDDDLAGDEEEARARNTG